MGNLRDPSPGELDGEPSGPEPWGTEWGTCGTGTGPWVLPAGHEVQNIDEPYLGVPANSALSTLIAEVRFCCLCKALSSAPGMCLICVRACACACVFVFVCGGVAGGWVLQRRTCGLKPNV